MLNALLDNPAAAAAGFFALVSFAVCPLFRTRRGILLAQLGAGVGFASHYALLGIAAPSLVNVLGSVQTSAALFSTRSKALNRIGYALIPMMIGAGIYFWTGPTSALCVAAMGLIALGRMQANQWSLRLLILGGGVFWSAHDYLVGAWIALTADALSLTMGLGMLAKMALAETVAPRAGGRALRRAIRKRRVAQSGPRFFPAQRKCRLSRLQTCRGPARQRPPLHSQRGSS